MDTTIQEGGRLRGTGAYMDANDPVLAIDGFALSLSEKRDAVTVKVCGTFKAGYGMENDGDEQRIFFQVDISESDLFSQVERLKNGVED